MATMSMLWLKYTAEQKDPFRRHDHWSSLQPATSLNARLTCRSKNVSPCARKRPVWDRAEAEKDSGLPITRTPASADQNVTISTPRKKPKEWLPYYSHTLKSWQRESKDWLIPNKEDFLENVHVLSCFVQLKNIILISCVFLIPNKNFKILPLMIREVSCHQN